MKSSKKKYSIYDSLKTETKAQAYHRDSSADKSSREKQDWDALMSKPIALFLKIWLVWLDWS